jgi:hypothetical protein
MPNGRQRFPVRSARSGQAFPQEWQIGSLF